MLYAWVRKVPLRGIYDDAMAVERRLERRAQLQRSASSEKPAREVATCARAPG